MWEGIQFQLKDVGSWNKCWSQPHREREAWQMEKSGPLLSLSESQGYRANNSPAIWGETGTGWQKQDLSICFAGAETLLDAR